MNNLNIKQELSSIQVNNCQKLLFLHQLSHNMTTDCSVHKNSQLRTCCVHKLFFALPYRTFYVHIIFRAWNFHALNLWFNYQSFVILWVNWNTNKVILKKILVNDTDFIFSIFFKSSVRSGEWRRWAERSRFGPYFNPRKQ